MRHRKYCIHVICAVVALSFAVPSLARAQGALEKFGESTFGAQNIEKYVADLLKVAEQLRERETETQRASQRALTFLNLVKTAKSDQEWAILGELRPHFNTAWEYLIETGSITGQQLKGTNFGKELPTIYEQTKKLVTNSQAATEFVLGEALVVGLYGRSAGELFRVWQPDQKIAADDLERLANASKSGIIAKMATVKNEELPRISDPMVDCITGVGTVGGDILTLLGKDRKLWIISILSVPGGVSQVVGCIRKLVG